MAMQTAEKTDSQKDWAKVDKLEARLLHQVEPSILELSNEFEHWDEVFSFEPKVFVPEPHNPAKYTMSF